MGWGVTQKIKELFKQKNEMSGNMSFHFIITSCDWLDMSYKQHCLQFQRMGNGFFKLRKDAKVVEVF